MIQFEVENRVPLLICETKRSYYTFGVKCHQLTFFAITKPDHVTLLSDRAFSINQNSVVPILHANDLYSHRLTSINAWTTVIDNR